MDDNAELKRSIAFLLMGVEDLRKELYAIEERLGNQFLELKVRVDHGLRPQDNARRLAQELIEELREPVEGVDN
jgi:hypothetical protein